MAVQDTESAPTALGRVLGTPGDMSPEQARGLPLDPRTDLFSFGVVLYELLTGAQPFRGTSAMDLILATIRDDPTPVEQLCPTLSPELAAIIGKCLHKDPDERHTTARNLLDALLAANASAGAPSARSLATSASAAGHRARASSASPTPRRWRRAAALLALCLLASAGGVAAWRWRAGHLASVAPAPAQQGRELLVDESSVLACPILEAEGVEEPAGWLGAAAATIACRRAEILLGGRFERTRLPAELLGIAPALTESMPLDPYGDASARERSLAAARATAAAYMDGSVTRQEDGFQVSLVLRDSGGAAVGEGGGAGKPLAKAVALAMETLPLPRVPKLDAEVARWWGFDDPLLGIALDDLDQACAAFTGIDEAFATLRERKDALGPLWAGVQISAALFRDEPLDGIPAPPIDRSSPEALSRTATLHAWLDRTTPIEPLADELHQALLRAPSARARAELAVAEASLRGGLGQNDRVRELALAAVQVCPHADYGWNQIAIASVGRPGFASAARVQAIWRP